jgi:Ca2+:H+ antiporter
LIPAAYPTDRSMTLPWRSEAALFVAAATALLFIAAGDAWLGDPSSLKRQALAFAWLFASILWASRAVVRHAEALAVKVGEPSGTLILTLSVISIEIFTVVMVMLKGENNPLLARDAMFSVIMIVLNGLVGLALLLGGLRHHEQQYNLQGASAFLSVTIALSVLGLVLPGYAQAVTVPRFIRSPELFLIVISLALYGVFLLIQTTRHRSYFVSLEAAAKEPASTAHGGYSVPVHATLLIGHLVLVIFLAEKLAILIDLGLEVLHAPSALGGLLVAILVLGPEGLGGIRAALANEMQRAVNILLGSALSTLALTIPAVLVVGLLSGRSVLLGVPAADQVLLLVTLLVSIVTFGSGRTNILQGAVHLTLFVAYLFMSCAS